MGQTSLNHLSNAPALRLLLSAIRQQPAAAQLSALVAQQTAGDWALLERLAAYHELEPLLWHALREQALPASLAERWRARYYSTALINDAHLSELNLLCAAWHIHGLCPILLKGAALAPSVYPTIAARPMSDLDLLFAPQDMATAWAVLSAHGYLLQPETPRYLALRHINGGELRLIQQYTRRVIELHWWLYAGAWSQQAGLLRHPLPWQRLQTEWRAGQVIGRLHPHDECLYLAHHLIVSNQCGPGWGRMLVDLDRVVRQRVIDWSLLWAEARQMRLATVLWLALQQTQLVLKTPIAAHVAELAPSVGRRVLLRALLKPGDLLQGHGPRQFAPQRWLLLLLLFDQPRDALGLLARSTTSVYWQGPDR